LVKNDKETQFKGRRTVTPIPRETYAFKEDKKVEHNYTLC